MSEDKDVLPNLGVSEVTAQHHLERLVPGEPLYPILSIDELPPTSDQRGSLPPEVARLLRPEEKVVHIHEPEHIWPRRNLSAEEVVMKAMQARSVHELGQNGPIVASVNIGEDDTKLSRYETEHGRDAQRVANDLYPKHPHVLDSVILSLAESQGVVNETYTGWPHRQERVGSIILVNRQPHDVTGQKFNRRLGWGFPFYGSVDAPANFVNDISRRYQTNPNYLKDTKYRPRDFGGIHANLSLAFERSVTWLVENSERNGGLIAYKNPIKSGGIRNQGWRDSANAMIHKNGEWASDEYGVAPIEVQGASFDAFQNAARIYRDFFKDNDKADELDERAWGLFRIVKEKGFINNRFVSGFDWDSNHQLRPIDTTTSAAARFLGTKMAKLDNPEVQDMVRQTVFRLFKPDMLTKWGLRTLSSDEDFYVPWVYHNGVWIYDTNVAAAGLSDIGYYGLDRILGATTTHQHRKTGVFYEHVSGDDSEDQPVVPGQDIYVYNELYQEMYLWMQAPPKGQTWSASTEVAKNLRYANPNFHLHAKDPQKFKDEKKIWNTQLPDQIKEVVFQYEPELYLALSS